MNIEKYLNQKEFVVRTLNEFPNIIAVRRSSGKRICLVENEPNNEENLKLMKLWTKLEIHPFMIKDNQIIDLLFNEKVNTI